MELSIRTKKITLFKKYMPSALPPCPILLCPVIAQHPNSSSFFPNQTSTHAFCLIFYSSPVPYHTNSSHTGLITSWYTTCSCVSSSLWKESSCLENYFPWLSHPLCLNSSLMMEFVFLNFIEPMISTSHAILEICYCGLLLGLPGGQGPCLMSYLKDLAWCLHPEIAH